MNYKNRDDELIRRQKQLNQNKTGYSLKALEKLAGGGYASRAKTTTTKEVPYVKPTVSNNSVSKNTAPKPSTRYNNQNVTREAKSTRDTSYDKDFDNFYNYREGDFSGEVDYDPNTNTDVEKWRNVKKDIMAKNNWSDKEFEDRYKEYSNERYKKQAKTDAQLSAKFASEHPVLGTIMQAAENPGVWVEGASNMITSLLPERFKAQSADDPRFYSTMQKTAMKQAVKDDRIKSNIGKTAYDIGTGLGDMVLASGLPVLGAATLGTETASRSQMQALERGVDPTRAALTGAASGAISGVMNKVGLDKALGSAGKTALGTVGKAAVKEGAENVLEDIANLAVDQGINTDKSQLSALHNYYTSQGMDDDTAWSQVAKDTGIDLATSFGSGALFGGVMSGARNIPALRQELKGLSLNNKGMADIDELASKNPDIQAILRSKPEDIDEATLESYKAKKKDVDAQLRQKNKEIKAQEEVHKNADKKTRDAEYQKLDALRKEAEALQLEKKIYNYAGKGQAVPVKDQLKPDVHKSIYDTRTGLFADINYAQKFAGDTDEAKQLAKDTRDLMNKYIESGSLDDYEAAMIKAGELDGLARAVNKEYKSGRYNYNYNDYFLDEDGQAGTLIDRLVGNSSLTNGVQAVHKGRASTPLTESVSDVNNQVMNKPNTSTTEFNGYKVGDKITYSTNDFDGKSSNDGVIKEVYPDHMIVDVPGVSDHVWIDSDSTDMVRPTSAPISNVEQIKEGIKAENFKPVTFVNNEGHTYIVTKSTRPGEKWQLSHIDDTGRPIGHSAYSNDAGILADIDKINDDNIVNVNKDTIFDQKETTIGEMLENPDNYTLDDFKRAVRTYDKNADVDDVEIEDIIDFLTAESDNDPDFLTLPITINRLNNTPTPSNISETESVASSMDPAHELAERYASAYRDFDPYADMDNMFDNDSFVESMANDIESGRDLTQYINSLKDMIDDAPDAETEAKMQGLIDELTDLNWDRAYTDGQLTPEEVAVLQDVVDGKYDIPETGNEVPTVKPTEPTTPERIPEVANENVPPRRSFFDDLPPRSDKEGKSKVGTNTMVNSKIFTKDQIDNDPVISELNKYAKANNDQTFNAAKEDVLRNGDTLLNDYINGTRIIKDDRDVDSAMLLLKGLNDKISYGDTSLEAQRNLLFSKLRQTGTLYGQTIQAFKKWNDTPEGAIINGERLLDKPTQTWKKSNKKQAELNGRIAKALEQMGVDSSMRNKPKTEKTHEQIKQGVKNVIEREFGSVENLFNDNDIEYLTSLAENKEIPVWVITDEIEHKMNHGEWYTIDESTPVKLETSSKLASILKNMGNDSLKEKNKLPDLGYGESHASIVQKIRNTLAQDPAAVDLDNPADVEVLANFIEEKIPNWQIEDEIHHRLMTGEWYTLDESIEPKKPINQKLKNALDALVPREEVEKEPLTFNEIRDQVRNTLDKEMARIDKFSDRDVDYLANLINEGATKDELAQALDTRMATGKFGIELDTQRKVNDLFEYANRYDPDSKQAIEAKSAAYKLIADEVLTDKASPLEKFESWRYLAMLGNPKTMVRNWIGNKMFGAVTGVSNNLSAMLEAGTDKLARKLGADGIQRTKAILNPVDDRNLIKAAANDGDAHRYSELEGTKYEKGTTDAIKKQKSVFNSKLIRLYEQATDKGISDYNAVKKKYSTSLAGYMKANGLDESAFDADEAYRRLLDISKRRVLSDSERAQMESAKNIHDQLEKARDYAVKQAEYATFHEPNVIASMLTRGTQALRKGDIKINGKTYHSNVAQGLGYALEGMLPFKKTPANILRSGAEYSPLNAINSIWHTGKLIYENTGKRKGNLDDVYLNKKGREVEKSLAADVIDSWSKTLTGSALVWLGYFLKNHGILNSSNKDEKWQDDLEGIQNYSITINGKTYTLDWAAPAVMPLLMGAEISKIKDRSAMLDQKWYENADAIGETINALLDPMFETSMLSGIKDTVEESAKQMQYNENGAVGGVLGSIAMNTATGYATQGIPTFLGQIARTVDNTRRTTDTATQSAMLAPVEKQARKIINKIPGLSRINQPYYDAYGRTQSNSPTNNPIFNLAYQMGMPSYIRDINTTDADKQAREAYYGKGEDGKPIMDSKVFPAWKSTVKVSGEKFSPEEMASYRKTSGEAQYAIRDALTKEDWFNNLDASKQTEYLKKINTLVDKIGKDSVDKLDSNSKEFEAYQSGGVEGVLNKWRSDEGANKAGEETGLGGSTNAMKEIKAAYAEGDTKKAEELTDKYAKYNKERERLNDKYGVNITMAKFTEREDANPGSNEAWAKEHSTGTTNNTTSTTTTPQVTTKDTSSTVDTKEYQKYIDRAGKQNRKFTNDIPKLKELNYSNSEMYTYAYAINQDSSLTPQTFNNQYKKLDLDGNGSMKQDEMITYFNNNNTSEQQAKYLWRTYGENKGNPWKTVPVLKNGTWKKSK